MISRRQIEWAKKVLAEEQNNVIKDPGGRLSVALAYPNRYYIGMSNLGFQTIYALLNDREDTLCERVFLPDIPLSAHDTLVSLERQRPICEFEILAFSVSYENDYLNILKILDLAGISLRAEDRTDNDPLVVIGGICASFNCEPLAYFADCFLVGEGEVTVPEFINQYLAWQGKGSREELLLNLAGRSHFYVPRFYHMEYHSNGTLARIIPDKNVSPHISRARLSDLNAYETTTRVVTSNTEFGNMFLIEIGRGCPRRCRFCLMTELYKPFRIRSLDAILPAIRRGLLYKDTIGLISASPTDHPQILQICSTILAEGGKVSVSSLRAESITEEFLGCLTVSGHKTITLAPEAGSERLRKYLGKNMTDELIFDKVQQIIAGGIHNLKFYFMIGLPSETDADIGAIESLVKRIKHVMLQTARRKAFLGKITVSINCFVPKPLSLFERCPMDQVPVLQAKLKFLIRRLKSIANVQVIHDVPKWAFIQGVLARGDQKVGELLHQVYKAGGNWKSVFRTINLNPEFYALRSRDETELLPWDLFLSKG